MVKCAAWLSEWNRITRFISSETIGCERFYKFGDHLRSPLRVKRYSNYESITSGSARQIVDLLGYTISCPMRPVDKSVHVALISSSRCHDQVVVAIRFFSEIDNEVGKRQDANGWRTFCACYLEESMITQFSPIIIDVFILSNKKWRVIFLIATIASPASGQLILPITVLCGVAIQ